MHWPVRHPHFDSQNKNQHPCVTSPNTFMACRTSPTVVPLRNTRAGFLQAIAVTSFGRYGELTINPDTSDTASFSSALHTSDPISKTYFLPCTSVSICSMCHRYSSSSLDGACSHRFVARHCSYWIPTRASSDRSTSPPLPTQQKPDFTSSTPGYSPTSRILASFSPTGSTSRLLQIGHACLVIQIFYKVIIQIIRFAICQSLGSFV